MSADGVDAVRELLLNLAVTYWNSYSHAGVLGRIYYKLVGFHPPDLLRVTEHQWNDGKRLGPPICVWCVDDDGLRVAQADSEHEPELRGMYFSVFKIRFGISSDARRVLWEEVSGPRAGIGIEWFLSGDPQSPQLKSSEIVWKS